MPNILLVLLHSKILEFKGPLSGKLQNNIGHPRLHGIQKQEKVAYLVKPRSLFLYAHRTDRFWFFISMLDII
jgi:hypothetical protein